MTHETFICVARLPYCYALRVQLLSYLFVRSEEIVYEIRRPLTLESRANECLSIHMTYVLAPVVFRWCTHFTNIFYKWCFTIVCAFPFCVRRMGANLSFARIVFLSVSFGSPQRIYEVLWLVQTRDMDRSAMALCCSSGRIDHFATPFKSSEL